MTTTNTSTAPYVPNKIEEQRFEFVFYINNHIICQRYFNIRDFNENYTDVKELMDNITGMNNGEWGDLGIIPKFLKKRAVDYLWDNYNPYYQPEENAKPSSDKIDKIDNFQFEIKIDKKTIAKSQFSGNPFPPKVRYSVDIREITPLIMGEIRYFLSQKK